MKRVLLATLIALLVPLAGPCQAEMSNFTAVYSMGRNGLEIGQVTDVFRLTGSHYVLVSESRATGPWKLLLPGSIRLESRGTVSNNSLEPSFYLHTRSDNSAKFDEAKLDWNTGEITLTHNGNVSQVKLAPGTEDNLSQLYVFLFMQTLPAQIVMPVVTGKHVDEYQYRQFPASALTTPAGKFDVVEYRRQGVTDEKAISVWVSRTVPHLPVQIRISEDGVSVEHRLISIKP
ncbi:MAG: DUF3108 domain-containing protein [Thiobacillaceae bacterium]